MLNQKYHKSIEFLVEYRNYLFILLLLVLYLIIDYQTILFLPPQGIHFIRQTDSLSFVANYYKNGFDFFHPQLFNLKSVEGRAACEFPILYYITAISYLIFNEHEFILRLFYLIIVSVGFLYLFKLLFILLNDLFFALSFTFLFISSTVLLYYANNFLPDPGALGLTLIGWYFFFLFLKQRNKQAYLIICFLYFSLASLIKVTFFINPIAAFLTIITYDISNRISLKKVLLNNKKPLLFFTLSLLVVVGWNVYMEYYNNINNADYFLNKAVPIWSISKEQIKNIWELITHYWYSKYYYETNFQVFLGLYISGIFFIKKSDRKLLFLSLFLTAGTVCYALLFYTQFRDHDYYFITVIPAIIFATISSFIAFKNKFPRLINNLVVKLLLATLTILSLNYAREKLIQRYNNTNDIYAIIGNKLSGTRNYLDSIGISENAKMVIITDKTPNGGLYFINRPGWSICDTSESSLIFLRNYINQGANYLLLTDRNYYTKGLFGLIIGEDKGIVIYKLQNGS